MVIWLRRTILAAALMAGLAPVMAQVPPPVPGLPDAERRISYTISGTTCACSLGSSLALYGDSTDYQNWVEVFINGTQVTYNDPVFGWTITSPTGPLATIPRPITDGVLTFNSVQTGTIQIVGARRPRRVSQFNENTGVPARNLNQALTDIVAQNREVWDKINDVTGRVPRAPPGESMTTLPPAATRANQGVCFDSGGNMVPCIGLPSTSSFSAGNGIKFTGTNPTVLSALLAGTAPIVVTSGVTDTISCPTCSTFTPPTSNNTVIGSRAAAIALNLSAFSTITTQGYANPGDGGGATFVQFSTGGFKDSTVLTGNISNAGASCTNGSYVGVPLTGGTGVQIVANVTVAGGIVTVVTPWNPAGNAYSVGDVLSIPSSIGCASARWTVATISTPTGSFTDSVGTKFQIVTDAGNFPNVRQFGAKLNWINATGDAGATDDTAAFKSGLVFAFYGNLSISNGGSQGGTLQVPPGTALVCATLLVPTGVTVNGAGPFASVIKQCDSSTIASVSLGDPNTGSSCFGPRLSNLQLFAGSGTPAVGIAQVFTNCAQQQPAIENVAIYSRKFECFRAVSGNGGAAILTINRLFCTVENDSVDGIGIQLGYGAAVTTLNDTIVESGANFTGFGINIAATAGGVFNINGFHCEQVSTCINWAPTAASAVGDIQHATGGAAAGCAVIILRQAAAVANQLRMGSITANGCTATYNNGGGAPTTGNVITNTNI